MERIILPAVAAMEHDGRPFKGVLYAGLMLTPAGPMLLEFNVRLGDPEAQVLIMRLMSDLLPALIAARDGVLKSVDLRWHPEHAVCVVMAASGYPDEPLRGSEIRGLAAAAADPKVKIFHAGTRRVPAPAHGPAGRPEERLKPGASASSPMAAACSASRHSAPISAVPANAPMPRSTGSHGPKASAAATSPPRAEFAARREETAKIVPSARSAAGSAAPSH